MARLALFNNLALFEESVRQMDTLTKFDNFIGLLNFFHVSCCRQLTCSPCSFTAEIRQLWITVFNDKDTVVSLKQFCPANPLNFSCAHHFIFKLAELEKKG